MSLMSEHQKDDTEGGTDYNDTSVIPNFIVSTGVEAGSPVVRGFVEFGISEQGLISAGARYKF